MGVKDNFIYEECMKELDTMFKSKRSFGKYFDDQRDRIVADMQTMIDDHPRTTNAEGKKSKDKEGKVRFDEFGDSSLNIFVLYYVDSPKWEDLIDVRQDVNYKIMEIVKKHNSDFAFPSTTVYLQQNN